MGRLKILELCINSKKWTRGSLYIYLESFLSNEDTHYFKWYVQETIVESVILYYLEASVILFNLINSVILMSMQLFMASWVALSWLLRHSATTVCSSWIYGYRTYNIFSRIILSNLKSRILKKLMKFNHFG